MRAKFVNESIGGDYSEAFFKMDKFMPDDAQPEFYEILNNKSLSPSEKISELASFIDENVQDEERMYHLFPRKGSTEAFAAYIIEKMSLHDDNEDRDAEEYPEEDETEDEEEEESGVPDYYPESGVGDWNWR